MTRPTHDLTSPVSMVSRLARFQHIGRVDPRPVPPLHLPWISGLVKVTSISADMILPLLTTKTRAIVLSSSRLGVVLRPNRVPASKFRSRSRINLRVHARRTLDLALVWILSSIYLGLSVPSTLSCSHGRLTETRTSTRLQSQSHQLATSFTVPSIVFSSSIPLHFPVPILTDLPTVPSWRPLGLTVVTSQCFPPDTGIIHLPPCRTAISLLPFHHYHGHWQLFHNIQANLCFPRALTESTF